MTAEHPGDPNLPQWNYRSARFTYGNWNDPQLYLCATCDENGETRPPIANLELIEDDSPSGLFVPLCIEHATEAVKRWDEWSAAGLARLEEARRAE
jgi:hypothetical protein